MSKKGFSFDKFSSGVPLPVFKLPSTQEDVENSKNNRNAAKEQFHFTKTSARNYIGEVTYRLKQHKVVNGVKKFLIGVGLAAKASDQTVELTQHKAELGSQALDEQLGVAKQYAAVMFEQKKQELSARYEERKAKRIGASK